MSRFEPYRPTSEVKKSMLINIVCVGIIAYYYSRYQTYRDYVQDLYFFLVSVALLIISFLIFVSCLISIATASILPKTVFEYLYHGTGFLLYLSAGITLLTISSERQRQRYYGADALIAASVLGLVNALLYLIATIMACRTYKRG